MNESQLKTYNQEKFRANKKWIIPLFLITIFLFVFAFYQLGKQTFNSGNSNVGQPNVGQSNVQELDKAFIGKPYAVNFTKALSSLLNPDGTTELTNYSFS